VAASTPRKFVIRTLLRGLVILQVGGGPMERMIERLQEVQTFGTTYDRRHTERATRRAVLALESVALSS
jgi:hypothetical protein